MKIKRKEIDNTREHHLLISLITDKAYCDEFLPILEDDTFTNNYSKTIYKWIKDYYEQFEENPGKTIQDIFNVEKNKLYNEEDEELISSFLLRLSDIFESTSQNFEYSKAQANTFIQERALIVTAERTLTLAKLGRLEEAEEEHNRYKKVITTTSNIFNPHDEKEVKEYFNKNDQDYLIRFPGAFGEMTGDLRRKWFVIFQGKYKGRKSILLQATANLGLKNRLKVFYVSLEMSKDDMKTRHYKSLTGMPIEAGSYVFPSFDCSRNALGTCRKPERRNAVSLYSKGDDLGVIKIAPNNYMPCTFCRKRNEFKGDYEASVVYRQKDRYSLNENKVLSKVAAVERVYGDNLRFVCPPRGTYNIQDMRRDLDRLEILENWIPDVIVVDYLQILKPEQHSQGNEEQKVNDSAVALAGLAGERNVLVCTASQVNKQALNKKLTKMGDGSNSARAIYAHADLVVGLASADNDKYEGILTANIVAARHKTFNENIAVQILQQLDTGANFIDSEFMELSD